MRTTSVFGEGKLKSSLTQKLKVSAGQHLDLTPGLLTLCAGSVFPNLGLMQPAGQGPCPSCRELSVDTQCLLPTTPPQPSPAGQGCETFFNY